MTRIGGHRRESHGIGLSLLAGIADLITKIQLTYCNWM